MTDERVFRDRSDGPVRCAHCGEDMWDSLEATARQAAADVLLVWHSWRCPLALDAEDPELITAVQRNPELIHIVAQLDGEDERRRGPHPAWPVVIGLAALLVVTLAILAG